MSTLSRRFVWIDSHDSGMHGWLPESVKDLDPFIPSDGFGICHDLLEHPKMDGTMEDEMLALGAEWFIRIETGRINPYAMNQQPGWYMSAGALADSFRDGNYADLPVIRRPVGKNLEEFNGNAEKILGEAFTRIKGDNPHEDADERREFEQYAAQWLPTALNWMRRGYLLAQRRYKDANLAADLFWDIADQMKHHSDEDTALYYPTMDIHVNIRRCSFNIVRFDQFDARARGIDW